MRKWGGLIAVAAVLGAIAVLLTVVLPKTRPPESTPEAVSNSKVPESALTTLQNLYRDAQLAPPLDARIKPYFTPRMIAQFEKQAEDCRALEDGDMPETCLDMSPIFCAQDSDTRYEMQAVEQSETEAHYQVNAISWAQTIDVKLLYQDNEWRVDAIHCPKP
jgi:hypothetical protein